jgi:hypothetical protein
MEHTHQDLLDDLRARLGNDYFTKGQDVGFSDGPYGPMIGYDGIVFAYHGDRLKAVREHAGRIESAPVEHGGFGPWRLQRPESPGLN